MQNSELAVPQELTNAVERALAEAKTNGAVAAEASIGVESGLSVSVRLGDVETLEYNHDKGLGITVYIGQSKGSASTSDLSAEAISDTVQAACRIARHTAPDEYAGIGDKDLMAWDYPNLDLHHAWGISAEEAVELALKCETAARDFDPRITNSEGATISSHQAQHVYGNSHGFIGSYPTSRHSVSCSVIGQDGEGMQRDYWYSSARNFAELDNPESVGKTAAERTIARLNPKRLSTMQVPVLFAAETAAGLVGHFLGAIRGGAQYRKTTFLHDRLNSQVMPEWMHIHEQPHLKSALGSSPFDNEGVRTTAHDIVKSGVLQSYVLDSYSARRLGLSSTGNAGGVHNLTVESSGQNKQELLQQMGRGLLVTELMGQGINGVTGDYSRGAAGFWVENGEIQYPVEEITIAGNLKEMLMGIVAVGTDVDHRRNTRTGSILLGNMTIAGE